MTNTQDLVYMYYNCYGIILFSFFCKLKHVKTVYVSNQLNVNNKSLQVQAISEELIFYKDLELECVFIIIWLRTNWIERKVDWHIQHYPRANGDELQNDERYWNALISKYSYIPK